MLAWKCSFDKYQPGKYIACLYDNNWYVGNIVERNDEEQDVLINFMKRTGSSLSWPSSEDKCWVPMHDLLCIVQVPTIQAHSGRQYKLALDDFEKIKVHSQPRISWWVIMKHYSSICYSLFIYAHCLLFKVLYLLKV